MFVYRNFVVTTVKESLKSIHFWLSYARNKKGTVVLTHGVVYFKLQTTVEKLSHPMKLFVADPEVPRRVTESLTVAVPVAVGKQVSGVYVLLDEYPAATAERRLGRTWSSKDIELVNVFVATWSLFHMCLSLRIKKLFCLACRKRYDSCVIVI